MAGKLAQVGATAFLAGLLATPSVIARLSEAPKVETGALGFRLTEVSRQSGIDFIHQAPRLDPKIAPLLPNIASMGAAVAVADFDRDGFADLYVTNSGEGSKNRLYRNLGNGTFQDVAESMGVADLNHEETGVSMGAVWGDYDNDGYEDLLVYKWGRPQLFHNEGGKGFRDVTAGSGLPAWLNANNALWLDFDRDGKLDLFVGGYFRESLNLWRLPDTRIMPESFEYATNGGRKYLFRNVGTGAQPKFEDVTESVGLKSTRWCLASSAGNLRGSGYPDIAIANDYGVPELFANDGGKRFREIAKSTGLAVRPKSGMNLTFGDITNEGRFAIYISNITENGQVDQKNNLWVPRPGTSGDSIAYDNLASDWGADDGGWSFGAQFGDLNNDGMLDLFLANGYVSANRERNYWYEYSKITGGNTGIIADVKNWPPMEDMSLSGYQQKKLWLQDRPGHFVDVARQAGVDDTYDGRSVAMADFRNTGALDVVVAHQKGPLLLFRNEASPDRAWVEFELEGSRSNRSAIGAEVRVFWNGKQQLQQVDGGSGFCSQNQRRLHFGLGKGAKIDKVVVRWPSGQEQTLPALETGKIHRVKEPA